MNTLYEKDLASWVAEQASHLRNKEFDKIDLENFIDEFEGIVKRDKRSMKSYFEILLTHMLKWQYQPSKRSSSWYASIRNSRDEINGIIEDSPSLKNNMELAYETAWKKGRKHALEETGLKNSELPKICPWDLKDALQMKFEISDCKYNA